MHQLLTVLLGWGRRDTLRGSKRRLRAHSSVVGKQLLLSDPINVE